MLSWSSSLTLARCRPSKEGGRVQTSPSIGTLTVSQQQAVFLWKSCYLHIAYLLASSVATGETQNQGSSLDCKICGRWLDNGMQVAEYDFAYRTSKDISARKFRLKSESEAAAFEALESVIYRSTIEGPYHLLRVAADDKVRWIFLHSFLTFRIVRCDLQCSYHLSAFIVKIMCGRRRKAEPAPALLRPHRDKLSRIIANCGHSYLSTEVWHDSLTLPPHMILCTDAQSLLLTCCHHEHI